MPFLQTGDSSTVQVPAGQSIIVSADRNASASVLIPLGLRGGPQAKVNNGVTTFGPFPEGASVTVVSVAGEVEFVVGASPALTDNLYNPSAVAITGGTVNGTPIGATTRSTVAATQVSVTGTDSTGTPGNVTNNSAAGRASIAATATSVTVTNSSVAAADQVLITPRAIGAPAKWSVTTDAGSFTVTVDAAPAAAWPFSFVVVKN